MKISTLLAAFWILWSAGLIAIFVLPMPGPEACWYLVWGAGGWELFRRSVLLRYAGLVGWL